MNTDAIFQSRILVIDDEPANVELLEQLLHREGFNNVISTTESERALSIFHAFKPDLILLDLRMPKVDGFSLLTSLGEHRTAQVFLPVIVLTADVTRETKHKALAMGGDIGYEPSPRLKGTRFWFTLTRSQDLSSRSTQAQVPQAIIATPVVQKNKKHVL